MAKYPFIKICEHCTSEFTVRRASAQNQKYCSRTCKSHSERTRERRTNCLNCNKRLRNSQYKFCSQSCAASYNNSQRECHTIETRKRISHTLLTKFGKYIDPNKDYAIKPCRNCGKPCQHHKRIYCSRTCFASIIKQKTCIICGCGFVTKGPNKICKAHKTRYRTKDREPYEFQFNINDYPDLFDLDMVSRVGFLARNNKNGLVRDHKVSIHEARLNNYQPYYIKHVMNCELMTKHDNLRKGKRCSITYEELVSLVDEYDKILKNTALDNI